ncbi:MAG: UDP-N-acetylglucosamine 2-epimerase (hydrolyzing) [Elusimicrobia bacterium]|nr:UDP-N-acetylglucosamine 2-epimerase (hydrolyzing) [Elusimicrobiota bacterium]
MRKIAVFIGNRANYGSIKSVMRALKERDDVKLQTIVGASALLDRFGSIASVIEADGFQVDMTFHSHIEGGTPVTMAKTTGLSLIDTAMIFSNLKPNIVVAVGDRYEVMAIAVAAAYMNIVLAHTMGGEVSGTIDESIRHAITKLAHIHLVATKDARKRIIRMGEDPAHVHAVGCPRIDLVAEELKKDSRTALQGLFERGGGVGPTFDLSKPFLLVSQHPVTTEFESSRKQIESTLHALQKIGMNAIMLWPNPDAGSDDISAGIRSFREKHRPKWLHLFRNLPLSDYFHLMNTTACMVGNSSSAIREGAYIGTPAVNIGTRQTSRPTGVNIIHADCDQGAIVKAIRRQLAAGKRRMNPIYGDGRAGERIARILATTDVGIQKRIMY